MNDVIRGDGDGSEVGVAIVVGRWNELVTKALAEGARDEIQRLGAKTTMVVEVPGAWEIPLAVRALIQRQRPDVQAVVTLGCILQGGTPHARLLAGDVGSALMRLQAESGVPIAWGILTPDTAEQALDRSGLKMGNKGREAAAAAVEMARLLRKL